MDTRAVKMFVDENPGGVEIRMVSGTVCRVPHRDSIWFTPAYGGAEAKVGRLATSFWLHDAEREETRLVNALLIREIVPLKTNGSSGRKRGTRRKGG